VDVRIVVKPMGGKQASNSFARGYGLATSNENWFIIRDRDLDAEQEILEEIIRSGEKVLFTGLTCIESYFLSPVLLQKFIEERAINLSRIPSDHQGTLRETLYKLSDYQVIRWALQRVRERVKNQVGKTLLRRAAGQFDLPNRLSDEDGKLPKQLDKESCSHEARELCEQFGKIFQSIDELKSRFDGDDFWSKDYQKWFHGKDVLKSWLQTYPNVGYQDYCAWAAQNLDWKQHPDLIEIQRICHS